MQVKVKTEKQTFKPVTIEITCDTAEELRTMKDMLVWNVSIPDAIYPDDLRSQRVLKGIMDQILNAIIYSKQGE